MKPILQPVSEQRLGDILKAELKRLAPAWNSFQAAIAFVKRSGVQHIEDELRAFIAQGGRVRLVIGVDQQGTSIEGLSDLLKIVGENGEIWINHEENSYVTFHPKLYVFEGETSALLIIGSGNLTEGGLYTNDEAFSVHVLDLVIPEDKAALSEVKHALDKWCAEELETVNRLDRSFLQELAHANYVRTEAETREKNKERDTETSSTGRVTLFGRGISRRRAPAKRKTDRRREEPLSERPEIETKSEQPRGFVMTLMRTDVGTGQTTPGTSRRSPEMFIPLSARDMYPEFWNWPDAFTEDSSKPGKFDRPGVLMRIGGKVVHVNMMTWPDKHDFRLRSEALRSAGQIGDILRIEKTDGTEFAYYVEIIPAGTSAYQHYLTLCTNKTRNSERMWGYYG